jgi:hypothetical protein
MHSDYDNRTKSITKRVSDEYWNGVQDTLKATKVYIQPVELSFLGRGNVTVDVINWGILLGAQGTHCAKPRGITLIDSTRFRRFEMIRRGRLVLVIRGHNLKNSSRHHQARALRLDSSFDGQMGGGSA